MKEHLNVFRISIDYITVKPSVHEVWEEIRELKILPQKVDIKLEDDFWVGKNEKTLKENP